MDIDRTAPVQRSLHVFGSLATGGAETWFLRLLRSRRAESRWTADVCLLAPQPGPYVEEARKLGCRIVECPFRPASSFTARLVQLLRRERYGAVHSHVLLFGGFIAGAAAAVGAPVRVVHAHNSRDGRGEGWARRLYRETMRASVRRFANLRIACSKEAADLLGGGAVVFPYGLDLTRPTPAQADPRAQLGFTPDDIVLGNIGRLHPQKNQMFLIDSFSNAFKGNPRLRLAIVGEGELRSDLAERIRARGLQGKAVLTRRRGDVPTMLHHLFDGFVMPSLYEGLPVALLEAQAAGLPCLVSDAISSETFAIRPLIQTQSIDADWGSALASWAGSLGARPMAAAQARLILKEKGFGIDDAWDRLTALYDRTLGLRASAAEAA